MKKFILLMLTAGMLAMTGCTGDTSSDSGLSESGSVPDNSDDSVGSDSQTGSDIAQTADSGSPETEQSAPADDIDYSALSEEEIYQLMVERSLMTTGDMTRMANVLKKAENGEEITVAYIGGSITEGLTVAPEHPELCWANLSYEWLCGKYPDAKINYVNAGLSGTPSILGNLRLERDVLAYTPDICFVEFAVNDGNSTEYQNSYESLVRTLLTQDNDMAVVLLFTVIENGHSCQFFMSKIGNNYGLPMISEPDSLGEEFAEGRMTWQDYSDDQSHPNARGHEIVRDFVAHYFENVMETVDKNVGEVDKTLPAPVFSDRYMNMKFIDSASMENVELTGFEENDTHSAFHNGWMYRGEEDASLKFTLDCKALRMVFKANDSKMYADAEIYVDGEFVCTVSSNRSDGWNNPETAMILDNDESAEHMIEIRVPGSEKHYFGILGFGYCE